jgi:hypothetical protein
MGADRELRGRPGNGALNNSTKAYDWNVRRERYYRTCTIGHFMVLSRSRLLLIKTCFIGRLLNQIDELCVGIKGRNTRSLVCAKRANFSSRLYHHFSETQGISRGPIPVDMGTEVAKRNF